ncbi:hypothetical protein LZ554_005056 [Drepanopeziza brunnea f. sp. 'monogermtubi']|nr:hypothetical protein LZ554_005056 [Drepanopeziza brunnea f. sp. 'monogermtubi']
MLRKAKSIKLLDAHPVNMALSRVKTSNSGPGMAKDSIGTGSQMVQREPNEAGTMSATLTSGGTAACYRF